MKVSARTQAAVEKMADRLNPTGEVSYKLCGVCGHADWISTNSSAPRKVTVSIDISGQCGRCQEIHRRYPELFDWLMNVFAFLEMNPSEDESS